MIFNPSVRETRTPGRHHHNYRLTVTSRIEGVRCLDNTLHDIRAAIGRFVNYIG